MASPQTRLIEYLPSSQRQKLLLRLMRQPAGRQLKHALGKVHPADIAQLFPLLRPEEQLHVLEILFEQRLAASTLSELDPEIPIEIRYVMGVAECPANFARVVSIEPVGDAAIVIRDENDSAIEAAVDWPYASRRNQSP